MEAAPTNIVYDEVGDGEYLMRQLHATKPPLGALAIKNG